MCVVIVLFVVVVVALLCSHSTTAALASISSCCTARLCLKAYSVWVEVTETDYGVGLGVAANIIYKG